MTVKPYKENGHLKTYKMKLTTLSPVFIGSGEAIKDIKSEDDFKTKVLKNNPQLISQWIDYFMNFQDYKYNKKDKRIPRDAKAPSLQGFLRFINNDKQKNSINFVKTINQYYIPGSSIKGAIRTALLSDYIEKKKCSLKDAEMYLKEQMKYFSVSDTEIIPSANKDGDCNFEENEIVPQKIIDNKGKGYSPDKNGRKKRIPSKEFFYEGESAYFTITVDFKRFKYSISEILDIIQIQYKKVIDEHKKALESTNVEVHASINNLTPNINIGGQSGFNTKVVLRALTHGDSEYIQKKKETLSKNFKNHNHNNCQTAPRYLKFVNSVKGKLTPGWCNISVVEE